MMLSPLVTYILSKIRLFQLLLLNAFVILSPSVIEENTKLLLVQTIFRHGDRAPIELYPTDPNSVDDWSNGLGELTQRGKEQQYQVGKFLRLMYKDFITSDPNEIYVNSSAQTRCLVSAESNLASFYAPDGKWKLAIDLNWQPIPIHYLPTDMDMYLGRISCPRAKAALSRALNSTEIQEFYQTHQTVVENLSNYSGVNCFNPLDAANLFDTLQIEKSHNLIVPEWAKTYWDDIKHITAEAFHALSSSPVQLRLSIGPFLGLITTNLKNKINGSTPNLKFVINSAHDVTVARVLAALNFTDIPQPPYCATLLIELHEMADASMAVRLLYMNSTHPLTDMEEPHVLFLDDCSEFCPVEYFMESYQWLIPDNQEEECQIDT